MAESVQQIMQRAISAFTLGDLNTAGQLSDRLMGMAPSDVNVWLLRGRVAARTSRWEQAEEALDRAAKLAPKEGEVPFARAMIRMRQGRVAEAAELLAQAEQLKPNHPEARSARANACAKWGSRRRRLT
jgi:predicted Zn-dependent protease